MNKTIKNFYNDDVVKATLDLSKKIDSELETVLGFWSFDIFERKLGLALDGVIDSDMVSLLSVLAERNAIITIPKYTSYAANYQHRKGEIKVVKVDGDKRQGKLTSLVSNQDNFKFSIKVLDSKVKDYNKPYPSDGEFRIFNITDFDGEYSNSWETMSFDPSWTENKILSEAGIEEDLSFTSFIHPNRWVSFYGCYYLKTKLMIERLQIEIKHCKAEIKKQLSEGVEYPEGKEPPTYVYDHVEKKETVSILVDCFKAELDHKGFDGFIHELRNFNQANLMALVKLQKKYNSAITVLRFMVRATEYALYKFGRVSVLKDGSKSYIFPAWIENGEWIDEKIKRTVWQKFDFMVGLSIRTRCYKKSYKVDAKYDYKKYERKE